MTLARATLPVAFMVLFAAGSGCCMPPDDALATFLASTDHEENLVIPLLQGGHRVVPLVLDHIARKDAPRRLYAIAALGIGNYPEGVPALKKIATDATEDEEFRRSALLALWRIEPNAAVEVARGLGSVEAGNLDELAKAIARGDRAAIPDAPFFLCTWWCR